MRWCLKMFVHALRSMRLLPAWSVDVHAVPGWRVEFPPFEERYFWARGDALRWAIQRANPGVFAAPTVVCFVSKAAWFDGLALDFDYLGDVCPKGLWLDWDCPSGDGLVVRSALS